MTERKNESKKERKKERQPQKKKKRIVKTRKKERKKWIYGFYCIWRDGRSFTVNWHPVVGAYITLPRSKTPPKKKRT